MNVVKTKLAEVGEDPKKKMKTNGDSASIWVTVHHESPDGKLLLCKLQDGSKTDLVVGPSVATYSNLCHGLDIPALVSAANAIELNSNFSSMDL